MAGNKLAGYSGELEVVEKVPCPNCGKRLMQLPQNYPVYDLQCTGCSFRAQVKTNACRPKDMILGAGWEIMDKVMKSGFLIPPLIANFKWIEGGLAKQKILFFPFIPKKALLRRQLSAESKRGPYKMFNYGGLSSLPHFVVYEE